nr:MAG TPA: hypothetical protein [Caudoviricetes sp.]
MRSNQKTLHTARLTLHLFLHVSTNQLTSFNQCYSLLLIST